ncbi:hypothetical protein HK097_006062, partial [Rhizophlyctis rosea]
MADLTTVSGITTYLSTTRFKSKNVTLLAGGNANFTFRVLLETPVELPGGEKRDSVVVKHAESFAAFSRDMLFSADRGKYEALLLKYVYAITPNLQTSPTLPVRVPYVYQYDSETHTLFLEDVQNSLTLKEALSTHVISPSDASKIGEELGTWLKNFHTFGRNLTASSLDPTSEVARLGKEISEVDHPLASAAPTREYGYLKMALEKMYAGTEEWAKLERVVDEVVPFMQGEIVGGGERGLVVGDFWSGNTLVSFGGSPSFAEALATTTATKPVEKVTVIDWEMSRPNGNPIFDVAQFLAEIHLLFSYCHSEAATALAKSFLISYGQLTDEEWRIVVVHVGAHM